MVAGVNRSVYICLHLTQFKSWRRKTPKTGAMDHSTIRHLRKNQTRRFKKFTAICIGACESMYENGVGFVYLLEFPKLYTFLGSSHRRFLLMAWEKLMCEHGWYIPHSPPRREAFTALSNMWQICALGSNNAFSKGNPKYSSYRLSPWNFNLQGILKEKKGRWTFLRRWKSRYFTLAGPYLTYKSVGAVMSLLPFKLVWRFRNCSSSRAPRRRSRSTCVASGVSRPLMGVAFAPFLLFLRSLLARIKCIC